MQQRGKSTEIVEVPIAKLIREELSLSTKRRRGEPVSTPPRFESSDNRIERCLATPAKTSIVGGTAVTGSCPQPGGSPGKGPGYVLQQTQRGNVHHPTEAKKSLIEHG